MALLSLFAKRDKHKTSGSSTTGKSSSASVADSSSLADTSEYVLPDRPSPSGPHPVYGNGPAEASSSKFHLGFRKRSTPASEVAEHSLLRPPQMTSPSSRSEADLDSLRLPPTRADLFSTYGDPKSALSTRSLPSKSDPQPHHNAQEPGDAVARTSGDLLSAPKKQGGLFSWAHRERKKSKVSDTPPSLSVDVSTESFNLKSFRHVRPESPSPESSLSPSTLVPPAIPRPRGNSAASDSSQRISVAAFREMAARRSAANSPTPSPVLLRPPSRSDSLEASHLRPSGSSFQRAPVAARSSTLALPNDSSSSESEDSGESESEDSAGSSTMRPRRQRTITQKKSGKASSELGHLRPDAATTSVPPSSKSALGHSEDSSDSPQSRRPPAGGFFRSRASQSASAMQPNAAARRASQRAAEKTSRPTTPSSKPHPSDRPRSKSLARDIYSDDSDASDDSDDAPLATLVRPPRPGSAASNATSGSRSRVPAKPLIDISQLGGTPPVPALPRSSEHASPAPALPDKRTSPPVPEKDTPSSTDSRTSARPTHSEKPSISDRLARIAQSAGGKSVEQLATAAPLERRSLDTRPVLAEVTERGRVAQPSRSQTAPMGSFDRAESASPSTSRPAPTSRATVSPNAAAAYDLTDPRPIVPTPIRERSPPPAFSVTSRPSSQLSLNTSGRLSGTQATIRIVSSGSTSSISPVTSPAPTSSSPNSAKHDTTVFSDSPTTMRSPPFATSTPKASSPTSSPQTPASPTSRPGMGGRQRSSTLIPYSGMPPSAGFTGGGLLATPAATPTDPKSKSSQPSSAGRAGRTRSSTMLPKMDITPAPRMAAETESTASSSASSRMPPSTISMSASTSGSSSQQAQPQAHRMPQRQRVPFNTSSSTSSVSVSSPQSVVPPAKPFAMHERGGSPASSTGDSSSGRTPLTPADGSDLGVGDNRRKALADAKTRHRRGASVSFEDEPEQRGRPGVKSAEDDEERRRERRRSEAKAAIELGKVVNGQISLQDDEEEDMPLNSLGPRMNMANPMMNFTPPSPMNWAPSPSAPMMSPSPFMMPPPNADPRFLAAHQHAMMVAKQAYQMAVAQQAMAAANEEWERGSSVSAFGGMGSMGMGMGGGMPAMPAMGMPGMMGNGFGMGWNPMMYSSAQSMYAGSTAGSELGVGWGSRSEYGGPTARSSRTSAMFTNANTRQSAYALGAGVRSESAGQLSTASNLSPTSRPGPRPRTKTSPSDSSLPTQHARAKPAAPPSSWKQK